jgi:hypothetical protein
MHVWRDELESGVPLEGDRFFISGAGFVIQDLEINGEPMGRQTSHDGVVGCNAVAVTLGLEGLLEDEVAIGVEGNHDIFVGRRGTNQLCLLERYLDVLVKHTTEIPPPTALVEVRPQLP